MTEIWLVDAYTTKMLSGNPAGVVPHANHLTETQMQAIASEMHAAETAFILLPTNSSIADLKIRYFTPTKEVDLCGHATIASVSALVQEGRLPTGSRERHECRIETNVGVLSVRFTQISQFIYAVMELAKPAYRPFQEDLELICKFLGISAFDVEQTLPLGFGYTGLWDLFVPVRSLEIMRRLEPDFERIIEWSHTHSVVSFHVYTAECCEESNHFHSRDFAPAVGIPEDPATGTATGALLGLLYRNGYIQKGEKYRFEQGYEIGRPSMIIGRVELCNNELNVFVGGTATITMKGHLRF